MPAFDAVTEERIEGPAGDSDEDLWEHVKKVLQPVNHFAGTCKMGRGEDEMAVVDKEFKVKGIKGLRVVDHSIAPLMVNNHVQSTCYLIVSVHISSQTSVESPPFSIALFLGGTALRSEGFAGCTNANHVGRNCRGKDY